MGLFDWVCAPATCLDCGTRTEGVLLGQTKLHPLARQNELKVGDELPLSPEAADDARYTVLSSAPTGAGRILQLWECPACRSRSQWFEVAVSDGRITSIESVKLDLGLLREANYVDDESLLMTAGALPDSPPLLDDPKEALRLLRAFLGKPGPTA